MTRPNLFIVGAAKAGTTSLFRYLESNPDVFIPDEKELHFFCTDFHEESDVFHGGRKVYPNRTMSEYLSHFREAKTEKIIGDCSTSYLISVNAPSEIKKFNPDAKIVIVIRDPAESLYSYYLWLVNRYEESQPFLKALEMEKNRRNNFDLIPKYTRHPSRVFYSEVFQLTNQIKRYFSLFSKPNIKIILSDDLFENTKETFKDLLNFLELKDQDYNDFSIHNKTEKMNMFVKTQFLLSRIKRILPESDKLDSISDVIRSKIFNSGRKKKLSVKTKTLIKEKYLEEVKNLSELLDSDLLKKWDYQ